MIVRYCIHLFVRVPLKKYTLLTLKSGQLNQLYKKNYEFNGKRLIFIYLNILVR
jgi:hypothetical protein